jgi:hypothetical protein
MRSPQDNALIAQTNKGTPMGEYDRLRGLDGVAPDGEPGPVRERDRDDVSVVA